MESDAQELEMQLAKRVGTYLQENAGKKLTGEDLVQWFKQAHNSAYEKKRLTTGKSTYPAVDKQIEDEIRAHYINGYLEKYNIRRIQNVHKGKLTFFYYYDKEDDDNTLSAPEISEIVDESQDEQEVETAKPKWLKLTHRVAQYIKSNVGEKYTAEQLAEGIINADEDYCVEYCDRRRENLASVMNLPQDSEELSATLKQQLTDDIELRRGRLEKNHEITIGRTSGNKTTYSYSDPNEEDKEDKREESDSLASVNEEVFYPKTQDFLFNQRRRVYSVRIRETESKNKRGDVRNRWLFPDIVGMEILSSNWNAEVKNHSLAIGDRYVKLWSLEVKKSIHPSNVRECFFQAVANSSWANVGYLVAPDFEEKAIDELLILSELHGIGFIYLNDENPRESEILIPARERMDVDWAVVSRIADKNERFKKYIKCVRLFCESKGECLNLNNWDIPEVPEVEED